MCFEFVQWAVSITIYYAEYFPDLKILCAFPTYSSYPQSLAITDIFMLSIVLHFSECLLVGII